MQDLNVNLIPEKNALTGTGALLYLIEAHFGPTILYLTPNPTPIVFDGNTYAPFPAEPDTMRVDARGGLSPMSFQFSVISREVVSYLEEGDLNGSPIMLRIVHSSYLNDPTAVVVQEQYEITDAQIANDMFVKISCGHDRLLSHQIPGRRFLRDVCGHRYKHPDECGYTGTMPSCSKRLEGSLGCRAHNNVERFGGWTTLVAPR